MQSLIEIARKIQFLLVIHCPNIGQCMIEPKSDFIKIEFHGAGSFGEVHLKKENSVITLYGLLGDFEYYFDMKQGFYKYLCAEIKAMGIDLRYFPEEY
jgi:hypothetical protein